MEKVNNSAEIACSENVNNTTVVNKEDGETKRIKSIDRFRGFCVFCMIIFQFLKNFPSLGFIARLADHSLTNGIVIAPGMTIADFIAPAFIFAVGLTYLLSFNKWQKKYGTKIAVVHYVERALAIIGLGTFLDLCNKMLDMFGGSYQLNAFDWTVFAFSMVAILGLILRLLTLIPKLQKFKVVSDQIFYVAMSCLGILNIIITSIDFAYVVSGKSVVYNYWLVLQDIGFSILIALPFVKLKSWWKFLVASIIFVAFSVYHQIGNNSQILDTFVHGGIIGGFGWGAMLIFDMFVADLFFKNKDHAVIASCLFCIVGLLCTQWLGDISMGTCSPTFILVGVGLPGIVFSFFTLFDKFNNYKFELFVWWGKNPIIMFLVEFFVVGLYNSFMPESALASAPIWLAIIEGVLAIAILSFFAYLLSRMKKSISL